jgi:hypothetical protein
MARHPMSSSWPQLTARTSVCGQSSGLGLQGEDTVRTARTMITTLGLATTSGGFTGRGARHRSPQPVEKGRAPGFK